MVIHFHPGKLSTKPDMLTRHWDVYPKEGSSDYASINPQNLRPVFTNEQLALSLCASTLLLPALRGLLIMDTEKLWADIVSSLQSDPTALVHLSNQTDPQWTTSPDGLLQQDDCIYVPDVGTLRCASSSMLTITPYPGILASPRPSTKSDIIIPGPDSWSSSYTTASHARPAREPSHISTSPMGY